MISLVSSNFDNKQHSKNEDIYGKWLPSEFTGKSSSWTKNTKVIVSLLSKRVTSLTRELYRIKPSKLMKDSLNIKPCFFNKLT